MANLVSGQTVEMADKAIKATMPSEVGRDTGISSCCPVSTHPKKDPGGATMRAVQYSTTKSVAMNQCPKPAITDDQDCIVKTTMSALCGTDLHLFLGYIPGVSKGMIVGHEAMGVVESVGPKVKNIKPGDRVIVSCQIACGECVYCKDKMFSLCDATNPVSIGEELMGQRTAALLGFNKITAGLDGAQADYVRVPIADVNCLVVPKEDSNLSDEKLLFLSDILCTSWFGTELAEVKENDVVAIWGAGPVGLLAAQCSFARGARRVILVDNVAYRLEFAKKILPKIETVDFSKESGSAGEKKVLELCKDEKYHAPDCCIECVGMHYAHSMVHRMEMAVGLETDTPEALNAAIFACRKGGHIGSIGAYAGMCNHFNIGALMMKNISLKSGPIPVQKYWHELYDMIKEGKLDPSVIITHRMSLEDAPKAYQIFNEKLDDVVKVVFTDFDRSAVVEGGKTA